MDLRIKKLIIEKDREGHIARHDVEIEEVLEIINGEYIYIKGKEDRWQLIGKTKKGRFLTVILGERIVKYTFGLVTARSASRSERSFYKEYTYQIGGDNDEED